MGLLLVDTGISGLAVMSKHTEAPPCLRDKRNFSLPEREIILASGI